MGFAIPIANTVQILGGEGIDTSGAANIITVSGEDATAGATAILANKGIASFDSSMFTVTAGFVQLVGGGAGIDSVQVDAFTAPGTNPVVPTVGGLITVTGAQVASGVVGANVVRSNSIAANAYTIEIQRSIAQGTSDSTKNGVSHFNNLQFSVDPNGFVSSVGTIIWENIGASQTLVVQHGYFCSSGAALSLALPAASVVGDTIEVTLIGSTSWTITQGVNQQIRIGNLTTTSGVMGSLSSNQAGDCVRLVCQTANLIWLVVSSSGGAFNVA